MSIIITEEDLCKKLAKKCAKICQFSSLPSKWFQAVNDPNTKNDFKPRICAYNYNTRTGFRDHKKIWGSRVLSSTLMFGLHISSFYMFTKNPPTMDVLMCYDYDPNENINCYYETEFLYMYSILGLNLVKMIGQNCFC